MRFLSTLALAGLFGALLLTSDASACHKKAECPPPAPVCEPAPAPEPVCEAPVKKHHFKMPKLKFSFHHKKAECAPVEYAPVEYAAPIASAQSSPQASGQ